MALIKNINLEEIVNRIARKEYVYKYNQDNVQLFEINMEK
jgi:hypothetical protein